jgi:uncharacterized protein YlxP (DUF503 family)
MTVATLRLDLLVLDCSSVREKRRRLRAIMGKLRQHFNVAVAEVDRPGRPAEAALTVVTVSTTRHEARTTLERVADAVGVYPQAEVLGQTIYEI